ncbi:unnamed protein product [Brassica rapa]|uniref:SWIM-type domain-containing protein n=1 Tax=Brassica campestris TaxID=3711 RepID=A0A8D9MBN3_BRACM|nr:unnamed protein product [Brassica rapa]
MKCYRAIDIATSEVTGTDEESFLKLPEYLYMLKLANPGTIADLETEVDDDGDERFLYLFLAFGASIEGFKKLRHVLVIDGTHLSGKYKGVLLTASGQDANFQVFPLAFAILVTKAATAYRLSDYKEYFNKIRGSNSACIIYLTNIGTGQWSRFYFGGERYNIMTSNIAEQLNNALGEGRGSPITELVIFIQRMMTRWFNARRRKAERHHGTVTVEVDKVMTKSMATMRGTQVNPISNWSCEVVGKFGAKHHVMLEEKRCTCKYFDRIKIPCGHAMLAADRLGLPYELLVGHWYKTVAWRETYAGLICPEEKPQDVEIPEDISERILYPPITKRQAGRRRKTRIPSTGEFPVGKKTKVVTIRCGRCKMEGHNRTRCQNPI